MPIHSTSSPLGHTTDSSAASPHDDAAAGAPNAPAQLVDLSVLQEMERDFLDTSVVERFARDFSATLDGKIDRLHLRIQDGDRTARQDAVRSVATSASMIGAARLTQAALAMEQHMAAGDVEAAQRSIALLRACGVDTVRALHATYLADR